MPDPYNRTPATPTEVTDPFEISLTTASQRLEALQRVKRAQDVLRERRRVAAVDIERAEREVCAAMVEADKIGAYALVPADVRAALRVAS